MGLNLLAVNKNYGFDKDGMDLCDNVEYAEARFGYGGYKFLRDEFLKYLTNNNICSLEELVNYIPDYYITDKKTYKVCVKKEDFEPQELNDLDVIKYLEKLAELKTKFPKLYDCFAFIEHCDCEGEMEYEQLVPLLPHLKSFIEFTNEKLFGYGNLDDLLEVVEEAINNKGKLYFT